MCFFSFYHYAGFYHAAFTFGHEADIGRSKMNDDDVPTGALITFVQKGLQLLELEANLNDQGTGMCVGHYVLHNINHNTPAGRTRVISISFPRHALTTMPFLPSFLLQTWRATSPC